MTELQRLIEEAYERRDSITPSSVDALTRQAILQTIEMLDAGQARVAEKIAGEWVVHQWLKKAVLLYFRINENAMLGAPGTNFYDKVPLKFADYTPERFKEEAIRVVPNAIVRKGAYISRNAVLMPSYVNIGARVGTGTLVDTWATVGSCAQIGERVHLSGGVGIGGVLEPVQAAPVIIEDDCFIGSRAIVVEGAHICRESVLGAGVVITGSTHIIDVTEAEPKQYKGYVPAGSVVIPGSYPKRFPAGEYGVPCALIIGRRKESTDKKTSLTAALRDFGVSV